MTWEDTNENKWTEYIPLFNSVKILWHGELKHSWKDKESIKNNGEIQIVLEMMMEKSKVG
jgi:hypothetical protein